MHSSDYIYKGKSTNNYVSEVKICLWRFKTSYLIELDRLHNYPIAPFANYPDCENRRLWGWLWMLPIVYWISQISGPQSGAIMTKRDKVIKFIENFDWSLIADCSDFPIIGPDCECCWLIGQALIFNQKAKFLFWATFIFKYKICIQF